MNRKKQWSLLLSIVLLLTAVAGGTLAFIAVKTASVQNQFESAYVSCQVNVNDDNSIDVTNTSNVDAYIRAAIVVNWVDENGNVRGIAPVEGEGKDYTLVINNTTWEKDTATGFYYYINKVAPYNESNNDTTDNLINDISETLTPPSGYTLSVEVIAEAIQADGVKINDDGTTTPAYQDAWGIEILGNPSN
ncbi:MAG: hypothetical protein IKK03_04965 [Lachnospiraceae bacterium]|nr:hypothetical protein [Lachnospiraceae bacterium]MBR4059175.1 hypothetical protein [Lachnospiraceae bacterium]